jgi:hypothetical protein
MKITEKYLKNLIKEEFNRILETDAFASVKDSPFFRRLGPDEETREFSPAEKEANKKMTAEFGGIVKIKKEELVDILEQISRAKKEFGENNIKGMIILKALEKRLKDISDL